MSALRLPRWASYNILGRQTSQNSLLFPAFWAALVVVWSRFVRATTEAILAMVAESNGALENHGRDSHLGVNLVMSPLVRSVDPRRQDPVSRAEFPAGTSEHPAVASPVTNLAFLLHMQFATMPSFVPSTPPTPNVSGRQTSME
nr:hypothetical protein CFP56_54947 [Quercus suber]